MTKERPKMYVVRKYVKAVSVIEAIKKEKGTPVHDVFIEEKWQDRELAGAMGFDDGRRAEED